MKKFLCLTLSGIFLFSLFGCTSQNASNSAPTTSSKETTAAIVSDNNSTNPSSSPFTSTEKTILRMAWWGSQTRHDNTIKAIELYETQNPNIDIQYEFYDFEGYFTKLNTLVASNEVWDIFQLGGNFPTYLHKIVPLDDYITQGIVRTADIEKSVLATTQFENKQLSISSGINTYGIAYDPAIFADAGVDLPTENWTWDTFQAAALKIHQELGIYGSSKLDDFIAGCSMGIAQENYTSNFFALSNDKLGFDDPALLESYLEMRANLVNANAYPDPGAISEIKDIEGDYLVTGEAAMTWVASNQMPTLATAADKEIKLATIPRKTEDGPSGAVIQSSQMLCVSSDSKIPEEAAKFIDFFVNDLEANTILSAERGIPANTKIRESFAQSAEGASQEMYAFVNLISGFKTGEINVISPPPTDEIKDQYNLLLEKVIYKEKTPAQAAKEFYDFAKSKFS